MLIFIRNHPYIVAGLIVFLILFFLGIFALVASWSEPLLGSAVITIVGVVSTWREREVWP